MWALNDLKSDAERYDNGEFSAINRSSVTLRTLFYNSNCILNQLGIARKIELPSFTPEFTKHDCVNYGALVFTRLPRYSKTNKYFVIPCYLILMQDIIKWGLNAGSNNQFLDMIS